MRGLTGAMGYRARAATSRRPVVARGRKPSRRRGVVCVVAMLYLILFAVLAVGFYFATIMSAQISANERSVQTAQLAAESGLAFLRYHLSRLDIAPTVPADEVLKETNEQLAPLLNGTNNLGTRTIGYDGTSISIPAGTTDVIRISPNGSGFRATITATGERLVVRVVGSGGTSSASQCRAIEAEFKRLERPSGVFDYGVASAGKVQVKASAATQILGTPDSDGSVLSTFEGSGAIATGNGPIEGKLFVVGNVNRVTLGGGTVGGSADPAFIRAHNIEVVKAPTFPAVDTAAFRPLATNVYVSGAATQKNIRVPPNTNPEFKGGDVVNGILYIESPNAVTFQGHATINGIIVFENKNDGSVNSLDFSGNVTPTAIPSTAEFAAVRAAAKGWAIAAPAAAVTLSGSVDATLEGSLIGSSVNLGGSADLHFKGGSIISLGPSPTLVQGKVLDFTGTAADNMPTTGLKLSYRFVPDLATYREVTP